MVSIASLISLIHTLRPAQRMVLKGLTEESWLCLGSESRKTTFHTSAFYFKSTMSDFSIVRNRLPLSVCPGYEERGPWKGDSCGSYMERHAWSVVTVHIPTGQLGLGCLGFLVGVVLSLKSHKFFLALCNMAVVGLQNKWEQRWTLIPYVIAEDRFIVKNFP